MGMQKLDLHFWLWLNHYGSAEENFRSFPKDLWRNKAQLFTKWVPSPGESKSFRWGALSNLALGLEYNLNNSIWCISRMEFAHPFLGWIAFFGSGIKRRRMWSKAFRAWQFLMLPIFRCSKFWNQVVSNQVCYSLLDQRAAGKMTRSAKSMALKIYWLFGNRCREDFFQKKWAGTNPSLKPQWISDLSQMKYKAIASTLAGGWAGFSDFYFGKNLSQLFAKKLGVGIRKYRK